MRIDPQIQGLLDALGAVGVPALDELPLEVTRARGSLPEFITGKIDDIAHIEDRTIPGPAGAIPVRIYHPDPGTALPALVYFHGGGGVIGSIDSHDHITRALAARAQCVVISVDYRLAPENPFPAGVEDAFAATRWVAANAGEVDVDPTRLAVGGDSAGGNLAAVTAQRARDEGGPPLRFQLLIYPSVNAAWDPDELDPDLETPIYNKRMKMWFRECCLPGEGDALHHWASPLRAENLAGLPRALIITAEVDLLRDDGEAYARRMREAGVEATANRYEAMPHGFMQFPGMVDAARQALDEAASALRDALSP